jgi:hypothetical protein
MLMSQVEFGVKFVGYSALVIARKYGRETEYAQLDFVTGSAIVHAQRGSVGTCHRLGLGPLLKSLPKVVGELQDRQRAAAADPFVTLTWGSNRIWIVPNAEVNTFVRQVTRRVAEIEDVLAQTEQIGARIERRPYEDFVDEIARTGVPRIEGHGFAIFRNGRLVFYPHHVVAFTKPTGHDTMEVHLLNPEWSKSDRLN